MIRNEWKKASKYNLQGNACRIEPSIIWLVNKEGCVLGVVGKVYIQSGGSRKPRGSVRNFRMASKQSRENDYWR